MKHVVRIVSTLSFLIACSGGEEGADNSTAGNTGVAGGGAGGSGGSAGQNAGGAAAGSAGVAEGGSGGAAGAGGAAAGSGGQAGSGGAGGAAGAAGSGGAGGAMSPGEQLYTIHCSSCHGDEGRGEGVVEVQSVMYRLGPEIQHPVPDFTRYMVRNGSLIRNPNAMDAFFADMQPIGVESLSDAELDLIIEYLNSFPKPTTGAALYLDYCANCHGANGLGAQTTRDITMLPNTAVDVPMNVREGHHLANEFHLLTEYMPAQDMTVLSDAELMLIAAHIDTL